jgi:dihydroorotate dehydrogenase
MGLQWPHRVGLAAGFDKDARLLPLWQALGFAFVEVGTVTPRPQAGNPKPRLFRLRQDRALLNRMGFNNAGVAAMQQRLAHRPQGLIVGVNMGKNKDTPNDEAVADYRYCLQQLHAYGDYFVVNVSSPNTPGLRELQQREALERLLGELQNLNQGQSSPKPLLLKLAPDLTGAQLDAILAVADQAQLAGLIATNTTVRRDGLQHTAEAAEALGPGGLSGAPLRPHSLAVLRHLAAGTGLPIIGVGGLAGEADAQDALAAGAQLLQTYTGLVYEGPALLRRLAAAAPPERMARPRVEAEEQA